MYRVFAQDCSARLQRRTLNVVEEVLKKRGVHVVVVHVPKQRIDCQKRLGNLLVVGDWFAQLGLRSLIWISQSPYNALAMSVVAVIVSGSLNNP